ncbi:hypothetical protein O9G_005552 [Rozella allomycis CSF55]|uniref:Uncharacterized protein n=1 Tax=Rozella allomycis (strain CSF55) TaxID=988480 RepID=A0A075B3V8_ROZAC|nr:hypothetical protein O9G_005552 [Rozella allomycis CSF55]|eukprot:EPZ35613.1 hypothetical protein O9G_005552 [Rozella allomycis CSF55]
MPGYNKYTFVRATRDCWRFYDPYIYNYGGVDMVLVTGTTIVGIKVTIATTQTNNKIFRNVETHTDEHHLSIKGLFVAGDDFIHEEENVKVVYLKNVYQKFWEASRPRQVPEVQDYVCSCRSNCSSNRCGCNKSGNLYSQNCQCDPEKGLNKVE